MLNPIPRPRLFLLVGALVLPGLAPAPPPAQEQDWVDLLAQSGPDLKGWTRVPIPPRDPLGSLNQWSLDPATGHLVCSGKGGHEWLRWDQEMGDGIFHVEWRFTLVPGTSGYNSGMYARNSADGRIWHQAQMGPASGGYLFGETDTAGKLAFFSLDKQVKGKPVKPPGEWNTFEIRAQGKEMSLTVNGQVTGTWNDCEVPHGYVGVEAEGYRIEFRAIKFKPL